MVPTVPSPSRSGFSVAPSFHLFVKLCGHHHRPQWSSQVLVCNWSLNQRNSVCFCPGKKCSLQSKLQYLLKSIASAAAVPFLSSSLISRLFCCQFAVACVEIWDQWLIYIYMQMHTDSACLMEGMHHRSLGMCTKLVPVWMELVERRRSTGKLDHLVRQKQRKLGPDIGTNFMSRQALFCTFLHPLLCSTETSRVFDVLCSSIHCSLPLMVFPLSFFLPLLKGQCCFSGQQKGKRERKGGGIPIAAAHYRSD